MTTDPNNLLLSVLANPLSTDVRMIYADWLEDCGDNNRAEFIRVQVELPKRINDRVQCPYCTRLAVSHSAVNKCCFMGHEWVSIGDKLIKRNQELVFAYWKEWAYPISARSVKLLDHKNAWDKDRKIGVTFAGGFVETITCTSEWWRRRGGKLLEYHPIRRVWLTTMQEGKPTVSEAIRGPSQVPIQVLAMNWR
jgi:uncharacterized protein (TIGR02996 family)